MSKTSYEIYKEQFDNVTEKMVKSDNTLFTNMNPVPVVENEYEKFKNDDILWSMYLEQSSISDKIFFINDIIVLETYGRIYDESLNLLESSDVSFNQEVVLNNTNELLEVSLKSKLIQGLRHGSSKTTKRLIGAGTTGLLSALVANSMAALSLFGGVAVGLSGALLYLLPGLLIYNPRLDMKIRQGSKKLALIMADLISKPITFSTPNDDYFEKVLDNMDISEDVKKIFDNDKTYNLFTIPRQCEEDVKTRYRTKLNVDVKVRNRTDLMKWLSKFTNSSIDIKAIFEFRQCVLQKMMDLYKIQFAELFVRYEHENISEHYITQNDNLKTIFTYFEKFARMNSEFKKEFEFLIKLRNLLNEYLDMLKELSRANYYNKTLDDIDVEFQESELNNITILAKWLEKELKNLDRATQKAIRDSIHEVDKERAYEELQQAKKDAIAENPKGEEIDREKEELRKKEEELSKPKVGSFLSSLATKDIKKDKKEKDENKTTDYWG